VTDEHTIVVRHPSGNGENAEMAAVKVTVAVGARTVALEDVTDSRIRVALQGAAKQVADKLSAVQCPTHRRGPTDVRIHFDKSGAADLKYDSCCAALGERVGKALG
jgi:hypothetical protein